MGSTKLLAGRSVLVVEDEPLIALDMVEAFKSAGASVLAAHNLRDGLRLASHPNLSAAVLDVRLNDGEGTALCEQLRQRGVPFVLHTGYTNIDTAIPSGVVVPKPAASDLLVSRVADLLGTRLVP